jgi:hypothetical protein
MPCNGINRDTKQFKNGVRIEGKEHPSFQKWQVETIVSDHIKIHKNAYKK